jgi:hypothetical protein
MWDNQVDPSKKAALIKESMENLYQAKWNIAKACENVSTDSTELEWNEMKRLFSIWCRINPPRYNSCSFKSFDDLT